MKSISVTPSRSGYFTPLMGWSCYGIGGLCRAPLLPASPIPSAHHARSAVTPLWSPFLVVRRSCPHSAQQTTPRPLPEPQIPPPRRHPPSARKDRIFSGSNVTEHSDFPRGEITAALLLRKKHLPARVRHATESTRHHHKNHHA